MKNLVFEGGGVKGAAFAGAISVLEANGMLKDLEKVAGVSAGSIVACLVALGYTADEIKAITFGTDFNKFKDSKNFLRTLTKYGLYKGDFFLGWIGQLIKNKTGNANITFKELSGKYKDLHTLTSNVATRGEFICSADLTPDIIVAEAVRASMSIPFFFDAFQFTTGPQGIFVDGGLIDNFPIDIFDNANQLNPYTLGFVLWDYNGFGTPTNIKYNSVFQFVGAIFETMMTAKSDTIFNDTTNSFRTIKIDDFGISPIDFALSQADKQRLYDSGVEYTKKFLNLK